MDLLVLCYVDQLFELLPLKVLIYLLDKSTGTFSLSKSDIRNSCEVLFFADGCSSNSLQSYQLEKYLQTCFVGYLGFVTQ